MVAGAWSNRSLDPPWPLAEGAPWVRFHVIAGLVAAVVALDMSRVPDIEYSALQLLVEGERRATQQGRTFWLAGLNPGALEVVRRSGLGDTLGRERMLFNARMVIERYQALGPAATAGVTPPAAG